MKLSPHTLFTLAASDIVTHQCDSFDLALGLECADNCYAVKNRCRANCSNKDWSTEATLACQLACDSDVLNCVSRCPCQEACPAGCETCSDADYCQCALDESNPAKDECIDQANDAFTKCQVSCDLDDLACSSDCNRLFDQDLLACPCNSHCPHGCPCPHYDCDNSGIVEEPVDSVLILNTRTPYNTPMITDLNGRIGSRDFWFKLEPDTHAYSSCSVKFQGQFYIFGDYESDHRQISVIDKCALRRIGSLPFPFRGGSCTTVDATLYLCFERETDHRTCHIATDALGPFTDMPQKSIYGHSVIKIVSSDTDIVAIGSTNSHGSHSNVERFNVPNAKWLAAADYPYADDFSRCGVVYAHGSYFVFGGTPSEIVGQVVARLDGATWTWTDVGRLNNLRYWHSAIYLDTGREEAFLIVGGSGENATEKCSYDEVADSVTCVEQTGPVLTDYRTWPELFAVPSDYCSTRY